MQLLVALLAILCLRQLWKSLVDYPGAGGEELPQWTPGWTTLTLRDESDGVERRSLTANIEPDGSLRLHGIDVGPLTRRLKGDDYEWTEDISPDQFPRLATLLGGKADEDILQVLSRYRGWHKSREFEERLHRSDIRVEFCRWDY